MAAKKKGGFSLWTENTLAGSPEERRRWVLEALEEEAFASLRETPEFQALREQASKSAWK